MKKFILIILFVPLLSPAQSVPGYLGKKQIISYEFNFIPSFIVTNNEDLADDIVWKMTYKNAISYDYIYNKTKSITGTLDYTHTFLEAAPDFLSNSKTLRNPQINSVGIGLGIKTYLQHLAPLGSHIECKLLYRYSYISDYGIEDDVSADLEDLKVSQFGFGIGYMKSRVFKDRFVFSYGMNLSILLSLPDITSIDTAPVFQFESEELKDIIKTRIQLKETIYFKFSIGYLI